MNMDINTKMEINAAKIRKTLLETFLELGSGHIGGSMSIVEVLSVLYTKEMRIDPKNPLWEDRDYLILSKGHAGPALYTALAEFDFFDKQWLGTINGNKTRLPSHPNRLKTPGVDSTTGSLGQGTSIAAGIGYALKKEKTNQYVYLIVGDGELNEGQCWEAFQFIAAHKLNNVVVLIDENKRQLDGFTKDILDTYDLVAKMEGFGFRTERVAGNDVVAIATAIDNAKKVEDSAVCVVLDTIKGQGVPYFENIVDNHSFSLGEEGEKAAKETIKQLETVIEKG